jgi:hypothetical protein
MEPLVVLCAGEKGLEDLVTVRMVLVEAVSQKSRTKGVDALTVHAVELCAAEIHAAHGFLQGFGTIEAIGVHQFLLADDVEW